MRKEPVLSTGITYVGLDAHQQTIHAAILLPGIRESVVDTFPNTPGGIRRFVRRVKKRASGPIESCYEAGPLGYGLQRSLIAPGHGR